VVSSLRGELEAILASEGCGITYRAGDVDSLADALMGLVLDVEGRRRMARHSTAAADRFDRDIQYARYADLVESLAAPPSSAPAGEGGRLPPAPVRLRSMAEADVPAVVDVHRRSFPDFFLTFLGPRFLRLLYREILREDGRGAFVAEDGAGRVVGFVAGVDRQVGFYRRLARRRWPAFALAAAAAALRRPSTIPRLFRALGRSKAGREAAAQALLMSIAVAPEVEGRGVGRALVAEFIEAMKRRGAAAVSLATDREGNDRVNRFYLGLGFRVARTYPTPEGRRMNEYVIDLERVPCPVEAS
jgi:ribosomal protein S18 acetylase RimI-like enzyme